jgi:hypothetical protein
MEAGFKKLRVVNGSYGINSIDSLVVNNTGKPVGEVLLWSNRDGVFIYGGGINAPKDITARTHENYWRTLDSDINKCFYESSRKEFWIISNNSAILYNTLTGTWRKISFGKIVKQIIKTDLLAYILFEDDTISYIDYGQIELADATLTTHYSSDYTVDDRGNIIQLNEDSDKIMQELFLTLKTISVDDGRRMGILYEIIIDGNVITPQIYFSGLSEMYKVMSPLLIKYKKAKIKLYIMGSSNIEIRDFGYSHIVKKQGGYIDQDNKDDLGYGHAFGTDFGNQL